MPKGKRGLPDRAKLEVAPSKPFGQIYCNQNNCRPAKPGRRIERTANNAIYNGAGGMEEVYD